MEPKEEVGWKGFTDEPAKPVDWAWSGDGLKPDEVAWDWRKEGAVEEEGEKAEEGEGEKDVGEVVRWGPVANSDATLAKRPPVLLCVSGAAA